MKLDQAFVDQLRRPIVQTWGAIAGDLAELGGRISHAGAMETVLDANRMAMYGGRDGVGKAADELFRKACDEHGYSKVHKYLSRQIKLSF